MRRILLYGALMVVPVAAALPNLEWRVKSFISKDNGVLHFDTPDFVPMDIAGANVLVPQNSRDAIGGVGTVSGRADCTGEAIFVYPTLPLFYYLADRPNPTRYGHLYPGAAETVDKQLEAIAQIERQQVKYVVWDQYWVNEWGQGGKFQLNSTLTDYLLSNYRTETMVGPFHILARSE